MAILLALKGGHGLLGSAGGRVVRRREACMGPCAFMGDHAMRRWRWSTPMNETEGNSGLGWGEGMAKEFCSEASGLIRVRIRRTLSRAGLQKPLRSLGFQRVATKAKGSYTAGKLRGGVLYGSAHTLLGRPPSPRLSLADDVSPTTDGTRS